MEIVHIAAEMAPIAKVGGLADVLHGLSRASMSKEAQVEVILPFYKSLNKKEIKNLKPLMPSPLLNVPFGGEKRLVTQLWKGKVDGVDVTFIESKEYFERDGIYGEPDDPERFAFFSKAALEYLVQNRRKPTVLHIHDWHTSLVAPLCRQLYGQRLDSPRIILTIHNLFYQGKTVPELLEKVGLNFEPLLADVVDPHAINLLRSGISHADFVTTVSPSYAKEMVAPENGDPLSTVLRGKKERFRGILNGIDTDYWNPAKDPYLPHHYSVDQLKENPPFLEGKNALKRELQKELGLKEENSLLVAAVTRLVPQKGPHLIKHAIYRTLEKGGQFVFLGSAPEGDVQETFSNLKYKLEGSCHVHFELTYNEKLSHLVYAASDLFLVPSLFEPCGLTQMIAMRYGSVPLVRRTGGLADTVFDEVNGFSFEPPHPEAIQKCLDRAFRLRSKEPAKWGDLIYQGMSTDHSWKSAVEEYFKIYQSNAVASHS